MSHYKTTLQIHSDNANTVLNALASQDSFVDFANIVALPEGHELISDMQTNEAVYYFLTKRLTRPLAAFEYNMYFVLCNIPELHTPSLNNIISFTLNYLSKFKEDGTFDTVKHAGYYPFPHKNLDQLYESGKKTVAMIDKYNINNLSYWKYKNWGSYTNALASERINENTVSFKTMSKDALQVMKKLIKDQKLTCSLKMTYWIDQSTVADLEFVDGVLQLSKAA